VKFKIEIIEGLTENEVIVRTSRIDETVGKLQEYVRGLSAPKMVFYKGSQEYYLPLESILFLETEGEQIYAHTKDDAFRVKYKLYELEKMLPHYFIRASKGAIVNTEKIYAINRNLASASQVMFSGTHKQIYVSRHYYKALKEKMNIRRR